MKSIILLLCFFTTSNFISTYSQIFSKEPLIKVRIIYTLDSLNLNFYDKWNLSENVSQELIRFNKNDSVLIFIKNDSIIVNNFNANSIHNYRNFSIKSDDPTSTLKIKKVP